MQIEQSNLREDLKTSDGQGTYRLTRYQEGNQNRIHRANHAPRHAFQKTSTMRWAYTMDPAIWNDIPYALMEIE